MESIESRIVAYLANFRDEGAVWTGDIARGLKLPTGTVNRSCRRLESSGQIVRVVCGNPTSWCLAEAPQDTPVAVLN